MPSPTLGDFDSYPITGAAATERIANAWLQKDASGPRPRSWDDFIGNAVAVEQLREGIVTAKTLGQPMAHTLCFAPPGHGKTTLAGLIAKDLDGPLTVTTASTLETPMDLFQLLYKVSTDAEGGARVPILFLDEIHMLGASRGRQAIDQESVYPLLEDNVWAHNLKGREFVGDDGETRVIISSTFYMFPFTCIGATTEPGMLSQALLRRFLVHVELAPYTEDEIDTILRGMARRRGWACADEAATLLARYARGTPGRAQQLLEAAHNRAVATRRDITAEVAQEIIGRMRLYPLGLGATDIAVLRALASRTPRGMGQAEICRALTLSPSQYGTMIEPYLRQLGFIEVLSRRVITSSGLAYLARLNLIDAGRPEVRAALLAEERRRSEAGATA